VAAVEAVLITPNAKMQQGQAVRTQFVDTRTAALLNRPAEKTDAFKGFR
jgi:hypothetical protein